MTPPAAGTRKFGLDQHTLRYLELSDVLRTHGADVPQMVNY